MTIFVDDPMTANPRFRNYCHLWTDGDVTELHTFARSLGLARDWFQVSNGMSGKFEHYDISPRKRAQALKAGAQYMPLSEWIKKRLAARVTGVHVHADRELKPETARALKHLIDLAIEAVERGEFDEEKHDQL